MRTHPQESLIIEAIKQGMSNKHIQTTYNCSWIMIRDWKKRLGMKIKSPDRSKETDAKIKQMLSEGKIYKEIIKELGVHSQRILKVKKGKRITGGKDKVNEFGGWF